jgi:carboxylate-amine ligase
MRTIVREGTSAHRQLAAYHAAAADGAEGREALEAVVDHLIVDTLYGL